MRRSKAVTLAGLAGVGAVVLGSLSPWATFAGFPGKMSLAGFPGGARLYCLILLSGVAPVLVGVAGHRRAAVAAGLGSLAVAGVNVAAIAGAGGGLGGVAWGAWLTVIGSGTVAAATYALPAEPTSRPPAEPTSRPPAEPTSRPPAEPTSRPPAEPTSRSPAEPAGRPQAEPAGRLSGAAEAAAVAAGVLVVLGTVVGALRIVESSLFVSFLILVAGASLVLHHLGILPWAAGLFARHRRLAVLMGGAAAIAFPFTQGGDAYWLRVFASIGVFAVAAIGLNVVVGLAGLLDLGYVAFFGVGAYVGALLANASLTTLHVHVPFLLVVPLGGVIAATFGLVIGAPTLRLRGDYLAIVTLGFGEIFRITANNWDGLTRGPNGISGVPDLALGSVNLGQAHTLLGVSLPGFANYYFAELLLLGAAIVVFSRLNDSRIGRAWVAIREDETAAAASGVNTVRLKLLAFALGAFLAGTAGTVNAHVTTQVSPDSYTFLESILLVAAVVLGGMGTVPGALLGSAALFIIPEKLRAFQDIRLLLFGVALILMMRLRPAGIIPNRRRQREFRDAAAGSPPGTAGSPPGTAGSPPVTAGSLPANPAAS